MELQAGLRFGLGPRFHSDWPWIDRLRLNGGVSCEKGERVPLPNWRLPTPMELELLLAGHGAGRWERDCCLWRLPEHLRQLWWKRAAEELLTASDQLSGYETFLHEVTAFARFKRMPLRPACRFDLLARPPGQPTSLSQEGESARLIALVNLGDETSAVVLWNRPVRQEEANYPLVKVLLQPGEGCWLPEGCQAWPAETMAMRDLDVLLVIREGVLATSRQERTEGQTEGIDQGDKPCAVRHLW